MEQYLLPAVRSMSLSRASGARNLIVTLEEREAYIEWLLLRAELVEIRAHVEECRDPDDDKFLELAVSGNTDVVISGDNDLLALNPFRGIPIMKPSAFLESDFIEDFRERG